MGPEAQNVETMVSSVLTPIQHLEEDSHQFHDLNSHLGISNEHRYDQADSEAETERLHESPTKKRLAEEIALEKSNKKLFDEASSKRRKIESDFPSKGFTELDRNDPKQTVVIEKESSPYKQPGHDKETPSNNSSPHRRTPENNLKAPVNDPAEEIPHDRDYEVEEAHETEADLEEEVEAEGEVDPDDHEIDDDDDDDDEIIDRESDEQRLNAISALSEIEIEFANIRNQLHEQQIQKYDLEIMMCEQGLHPELAQYNQQLEEDRDAQLKRIKNLLTFEMNSILTESHATRCIAHQTFYKGMIALRQELNNNITRKWSNLNKERNRNSDDSQEFGYYASSQPYKTRKLTEESLGVVKTERLLGLPLAPNIPRATDAECKEDFRSLGFL